jgi:hypothetical protein
MKTTSKITTTTSWSFFQTQHNWCNICLVTCGFCSVVLLLNLSKLDKHKQTWFVVVMDVHFGLTITWNGFFYWCCLLRFDLTQIKQAGGRIIIMPFKWHLKRNRTYINKDANPSTKKYKACQSKCKTKTHKRKTKTIKIVVMK